MRIRRRRILNKMTGMLLVLVLVLLALEVVGCNEAIRPAEWPELRMEGEAQALRLEPRNNKEVAELSADDIVRVMRQVGLSDEEILELGPDLRDALLSSGAAVIIDGRRIEMTFRVNGTYLLIRSRLHGSLIYDLSRGGFGLFPSAP